jgi:hypothetical protein
MQQRLGLATVDWEVSVDDNTGAAQRWHGDYAAA